MDLAQRFFGLQPNGRVFTEDAAVAVQQLLRERRDSFHAGQRAREAGPDLARSENATESAGGYDFILHDVFTGALVVCAMLMSRARGAMLVLL